MKTNINISAFFRDLFLVETECTFSFAIVGTLFARSASISYAYFFIPLMLGIICMIPCLPVYLKENMTIPQVIVQRVLELVILEAVCIWTGRLLAGAFLGKIGFFAVGASVLFFDVLSYTVMYLMEKAESKRLNEKLHGLAEKITASEVSGQEDSQQIEKKYASIEVFGEHNSHVLLSLREILYFEADGEMVFAYTNEEIYQVKQRLYQVESISHDEGIIRVSKSHLVNYHKIQSVRPALNSRMYAKMPNGEEVLVSRKYAPKLKESLAC
ncbi:MAG: LytTR family transcriptional regulator [Treponema sp.]|nr:LytTR family transcriptional regulator [Treponema sp.]